MKKNKKKKFEYILKNSVFLIAMLLILTIFEYYDFDNWLIIKAEKIFSPSYRDCYNLMKDYQGYYVGNKNQICYRFQKADIVDEEYVKVLTKKDLNDFKVYLKPNNFEINIVDLKKENYPIQLNQYAKSYDKIFFRGEIVKNSNIDSFLILDDYGLAKDDKYVFYEGRVVDKNLNGKDFTRIAVSDYYQDKEHVFSYTQRKILSEVKPEEFELIDSHKYAKSNKAIFYYGLPLEGIILSNFKRLKKSEYYSDGKNIIYEGRKMCNIDLNSFKVLDFGYAKDINNIYLKGKRILNIKKQGFDYENNQYGNDLELTDTCQ